MGSIFARHLTGCGLGIGEFCGILLLMDPRFSPHGARIRAPLLMVAAVAALTAGCGGSATGPDEKSVDAKGTLAEARSPGSESLVHLRGGSSRGFFPLSIDSEWELSGLFQTEMIPADSHATLATAGIEVYEFWKNVGTESRNGLEYVVQMRRIETDGGKDDPAIEWYRYRQDKAGLYEADVSTNLPPSSAPELRASAGKAIAGSQEGVDPYAAAWAGLASSLDPDHRPQIREAWERSVARLRVMQGTLRGGLAHSLAALGPPGGAEPEELTRLAYPLRPGASWVVRDLPDFRMTVESLEVLDLPEGRLPSYRIRLTSSLFSPEDRAYLWFSRWGLLALYLHAETVATDPAGNPIGILIVDDMREVGAIRLAEPGPFAHADF